MRSRDAEQVSKIPEGDRQLTPTGDTFVKASVRKGILPVILDELLAARKVSNEHC